MPKERSKYLYERISPRNAALFIILFTVLISGGTLFTYSLVRYLYQKRSYDTRYLITSILQEARGGGRLKTDELAEILELSSDQPKNLYAFDIKQAETLLKNYPVIADARVRKVYPGTVSVVYQTREPVALIDDYENLAVDKEGTFFPYYPFYPLYDIPRVYLGESPISFALELFENCRAACRGRTLQLKAIDTSKAFHPSLGRREIVVVFEEEGDLFLRLPTHGWREGVVTFMDIYSRVKEREASYLFDLRICNTCYYKKL